MKRVPSLLLVLSLWLGTSGLMMWLTGPYRRPWIALAAFSGVTFVILVTVVSALFVAIAVHELGHLLLGYANGFEFRLFAVGPLEIRATGGRLRFRIAPHFRTSGMVMMIPRNDRDLARRMLFFVLGGPCASLAYTILLYRAFVTTRLAGPQDQTEFYAYLATLALFVMSVAILPGTLLPYNAATGNPTDARIVLTLLGEHGSRDRLIAQLILSREIHGSLRARDWTPHLIEKSAGSADGSIYSLRGRILMYYHLLDLKQSDAARDALAEARSECERVGKSAGTLREATLLETAFGAAWWDGDWQEAERLLNSIAIPTESLAGTRSRAEATIALRKGDSKTALDICARARASLAESERRYGGNVALEFDLISEIEAQAASDSEPNTEEDSDATDIGTTSVD